MALRWISLGWRGEGGIQVQSISITYKYQPRFLQVLCSRAILEAGVKVLQLDIVESGETLHLVRFAPKILWRDKQIAIRSSKATGACMIDCVLGGAALAWGTRGGILSFENQGVTWHVIHASFFYSLLQFISG